MFLGLIRTIYSKNHVNIYTIPSKNFSKDIFKRPVSKSDMDYEEYRKKFLDVENEKWVIDEKLKNSGKELFYPKHGNSFWDPTINDVKSKKK